MIPKKKIELFARKNFIGWDNLGLEIPKSKIKIFSQEEIDILIHEFGHFILHRQYLLNRRG